MVLRFEKHAAQPGAEVLLSHHIRRSRKDVCKFGAPFFSAVTAIRNKHFYVFFFAILRNAKPFNCLHRSAETAESAQGLPVNSGVRPLPQTLGAAQFFLDVAFIAPLALNIAMFRVSAPPAHKLAPALSPPSKQNCQTGSSLSTSAFPSNWFSLLTHVSSSRQKSLHSSTATFAQLRSAVRFSIRPFRILLSATSAITAIPYC